MPKNKFRTNFWIGRLWRHWAFFYRCQTQFSSNPISSLPICVLLLPHYVFLLIFFYRFFIFCLCLSLKADRGHINLQPAVSTMLINFPSCSLAPPCSTPKPNRADQWADGEEYRRNLRPCAEWLPFWEPSLWPQRNMKTLQLMPPQLWFWDAMTCNTVDYNILITKNNLCSCHNSG